MRRQVFGTAMLVVAVVISPLMFASPAIAAQSPTTSTIGGMTQEQFVAAAVKQGVSEKVAMGAWGDESAMSVIPVSSGTSSFGSARTDTMVATPNASGSKTQVCRRTSKNIFGGLLTEESVKVKFSYNGSTVSGISASHSYQTGFFWYYESEVASSDAYASWNGNSHGSYRSSHTGLFGNDVPATYHVNAKATLTVRANGTSTCTGSGGA